MRMLAECAIFCDLSTNTVSERLNSQRNRLHLLRREIVGVMHDSQRIAAEAPVCEHVERMKIERHEYPRTNAGELMPHSLHSSKRFPKLARDFFALGGRRALSPRTQAAEIRAQQRLHEARHGHGCGLVEGSDGDDIRQLRTRIGVEILRNPLE